MHTLQPKHTKIEDKEAEKLLLKYNIVLSQLPKISLKDSGIPEGCNSGDVLKIERAEETYFRVVI